MEDHNQTGFSHGRDHNFTGILMIPKHPDYHNHDNILFGYHDRDYNLSGDSDDRDHNRGVCGVVPLPPLLHPGIQLHALLHHQNPSLDVGRSGL